MDRVISAGDARAWRLAEAAPYRSPSAPHHLHGGVLMPAVGVERFGIASVGEPYPSHVAKGYGFHKAGLWIRCGESLTDEPPVVVMEFVQDGIAARPGSTGKGHAMGAVDISPWLAERSDDEIRSFAEDSRSLNALSLSIMTALHEAGNPTVRHGTGKMGPVAMDGIVRLEVLDAEATRAGLEDTLRRREPDASPSP